VGAHVHRPGRGLRACRGRRAQQQCEQPPTDPPNK
jgi:hypothetical protein